MAGTVQEAGEFLGSGFLGERPPRVTITNTRTGVTRKVQFNPTDFEEVIAANYARQVVPGLSHEVLQFSNTGNRTLEFELYFHNTNYNAGSRGYNPIMRMRRFLRSLMYPRAGGGRANGGPPRILFTAPNMFAIEAVVTSLKFNYSHMNRVYQPRIWLASLSIEEIRDFMILSEEVLDLEGE